MMHYKKDLFVFQLMIFIGILIFMVSFIVPKAEGISSAGDKMHLPTQNDLGRLCEENGLSYELVLAIFYTEGIQDISHDVAKTEIEKLVYLRDYWADQGFSDEIVFELMLLSREKGFEECLIYLNNDDSYAPDDYVQKVTEYKSISNRVLIHQKRQKIIKLIILAAIE